MFLKWQWVYITHGYELWHMPHGHVIVLGLGIGQVQGVDGIVIFQSMMGLTWRGIELRLRCVQELQVSLHAEIKAKVQLHTRRSKLFLIIGNLNGKWLRFRRHDWPHPVVWKNISARSQPWTCVNWTEINKCGNNDRSAALMFNKLEIPEMPILLLVEVT